VAQNLPSLTAVVSRFPAPSQTFILRKLIGLREAGMAVTVASTSFTASSAELGFPMLSLMPWQSPRVAIQPSSRSAWPAAFSAVFGGGQKQPGGLRHRVTLAPLRAIDSDIAHFEFSGIAASYLDELQRLNRDTKITVSCRGAAEQIEPLKNPQRRVALERVFEIADLIHCVSDDMRQTVEGLGAPASKILVNRPAIPVDQFSSLRSRELDHEGPFRLLSIGRLHWKKGFDDSIRAVAALRKRGIAVDYRIAGEGPEREKLMFMIHELDCEDSISLVGSLGQPEIKELLGWSDALLLPSLSEGISNAVLEAMAAGLPVVSTRCGGMAEVVEDGVNGILVEVGDTGAMCDHLAELANSASTRSRLGLAAAATADERLDISHQVGRFISAYSELIAAS
jgi:colanic acid/amylovoran biosynthesis glycosyltransferase